MMIRLATQVITTEAIILVHLVQDLVEVVENNFMKKTILIFLAFVVPHITFAQQISAGSEAVQTIFYALLGIILSAVGYFVIDLITPGHLGRSIKEEQNLSAALVVAASMLSTAMIISAVMLS